MQPLEAVDRLRWVERSLAGIVQHLGGLEAELDAILQCPPALTDEERALAGAIRAEMDALRRDGAVVQTQLARIRTRRGRPGDGASGGASGGTPADDLPLAM